MEMLFRRMSELEPIIIDHRIARKVQVGKKKKKTEVVVEERINHAAVKLRWPSVREQAEASELRIVVAKGGAMTKALAKMGDHLASAIQAVGDDEKPWTAEEIDAAWTIDEIIHLYREWADAPRLTAEEKKT